MLKGRFIHKLTLISKAVSEKMYLLSDCRHKLKLIIKGLELLGYNYDLGYK